MTEELSRSHRCIHALGLIVGGCRSFVGAEGVWFVTLPPRFDSSRFASASPFFPLICSIPPGDGVFFCREDSSFPFFFNYVPPHLLQP
jgi:hypothetical protein